MEGRTLGSYKVLERLGAGGQGHVYRALDTTLDREIAIKVLPTIFVTDPVRLKQFQQEAKLLAAASHPNIAAVYGIEHFEEVHFFTQELVPGRSLEAKLKEGHLDVEDALDICRQIAAALEMAHERRLVHRDLKPANVMVKPDGGVKVLDFGLALPVDSEETDEHYALSDSTPTISRSADAIIVGTAPYMSPDQARGKSVDHRTDIWSFGCVLYECLTGKRPFKGETLLDTLSAIVRTEPDWDLLPPTVPRRVTNLIQRCMRKRLSDRLQHIGDGRIVLEEVLAGPLPDARMAEVEDGVVAVAKPAWGLAAAAAIVGLVIGSAAAWAWMRPAVAASSAMRTVVVLEPARLDVDKSTTIDIRPDGSGVVYAGNLDGESQIYYRALDSFEAIAIDGTQGGENPFFAPDGEWIGFFTDDFKLARVPVSGGVAIPITELRVGNWGATWLPDDSIVYGTFSTGRGLMRVAAAGGEPTPVTTLSFDAGETNHGWPHVLPGGKALLFTVTTTTGTSVAVLDLESGDRRMLVAGASDARYVESGHLVYAQLGSLFAVPFELDQLRTVGTARPVVDDLFTHNTAQRVSYAIGANGTLVYATGETGVRRDEFVWVDRFGIVEPTTIESGNYGHPRLSPSGDRLAYDSFREGRADIWVSELGSRRTPTRLTDAGENVLPVWSPDGTEVLFASTGFGAAGLYLSRADGGSDVREWLAADYSPWPVSWHPNATVAYYELNPDTGRDIWLRGTDDDQPRVFQKSRFNERSPMFSPDGRWIAYVSNASGSDEVYVKQVGESGAQHTISEGGGSEPVWAPDGGELFYRSGGWMMAVEVAVPEAGSDMFRVGRQAALFADDFKSEFVAGNQYYDVARNGQRFLMIKEDPALRGPDRLHVVLGFADELAANDSGQD